MVALTLIPAVVFNPDEVKDEVSVLLATLGEDLKSEETTFSGPSFASDKAASMSLINDGISALLIGHGYPVLTQQRAAGARVTPVRRWFDDDGQVPKMPPD